MKVVIVGTGNTATVLGRKIAGAGHEIRQVLGRTEAHAKRLALELDCGYAIDWSGLDREADLYLIALPDALLYDLGDKLSIDPKLVVHTAGSVSRSVLGAVSGNHGVMYPLQSLRKELPGSPPIPLLVDGNSAKSLGVIYDFARSVSSQVERADDDRRLKLHLAAVVVNNFTNHLYELAENFCRQEGLDFSLLWPLITETAVRLPRSSPGRLRTGPASRNDAITLGKHLALLGSYPALKELYALFTRQIRGE